MIAIGLAAVLGLAAVGCLVRPDWTRRVAAGFPRHKGMGWVLTALTLAWSLWLLWNTPLGRFDSWKPLSLVLAPVAYILIVLCMDELLAARALGVLFILVPAPILNAIRWDPSTWRLVVTVLAYIIATAGIALVLSPYLLRRWGQRLCGTPTRMRACGITLAALTALLAVLTIAVY